ncbi:glyoxal reductase-like isoform X2 [Lineus longissimus]|uniref:glyoxal reductase-like isoform X2 n=1 Tax=Lineus longissimus TaxID=88925 RepID=UPI002B4C5D13
MQRIMSGAVKIAKSFSCTTTLRDGVEMPLFGLGTYWTEKGDDSAVERTVTDAIKLGYRLIDTAQFYENEEDVGRGVRKSGLPRDKIFVVSKLSWLCHGVENTKKAIEESLQKLDIEYIDLFLIHTPKGGKILETYDEILKFKAKGLIRSVGVSNFNIQHLEGLKNAGRPAPSVDQFELHPWQQRKELVEYCKKNDIAVMGYSPLGKGKKLDDAEMTKIASKYKKSNAQFLIRWGVQNGFITIPKSSKSERVKQNAEVFDFTISDEDMATLAVFKSWTCMNDKWISALVEPWEEVA